MLHLEHLRHGHRNTEGLLTFSESPRSISCKGVPGREYERGKRARQGNWSPASALLTTFVAQQKSKEGQPRGAESRHAASHQGTCAHGPSPGDSDQGSAAGHYTDPSQHSSASLSGGPNMEREPAEGSRQPAPSQCADHLSLRTLAQNLAGADGAGVGKCQKPRMADGSRMAVPDLVYLSWSPDCRQRKGPTCMQDLTQVLQTMIPFLAVPYMINRFHANRAFKDNTDRVKAFQLEVSGRTDQCQVVRTTLEKLSGSAVLQMIGTQRRRDSLKQSPAAEISRNSSADASVKAPQ